MKIIFFTVALMLSPGVQSFSLVSQYPDQRGWGSRPLVFRVNRANCPADLDTFLDQAVKIWNSVPESSLKVEIGADTSNTIEQLYNGTATDVPMIACDPNFSATASVDGNSIPGVGFLRGSDLNPVTNGGLLLNVEEGTNANINIIPDVLVAVVVAHEIGHVLGIGHTNDTTALMYYDATAKNNLSLSQDDRNAVSFLYPRNEIGNLDLIGGCGSISSLSSKGGGGSFLGGNSLGLLSILFALYLGAKALIKNKRPRLSEA